MTTFEQDLSEITRRENHLWVIALALLILVVVVAAGAFLVLFNRAEGIDPAQRSLLLRGLAGLLVLTVLFCVYVLHSRATFGRIRQLFEAQALRDTLTGLFNRQSFPERARIELLRARRDHSGLGIMLCDLDDFKHINDTHGHPRGDEVLRRVANAVLSATRGTDLAFRWGGDEILVVLSNVQRTGSLVAAQRIRDEVAAVRTDLGLPIDVSIGLALYPDHGEDVDKLIHLADQALYIAKRSGDKIHVGEEELPLGDEAVNLVFQPVVNSSTGETLGYEILSRDPNGEVSILDLFRRYEAVGQLDNLKRRIFLQQLRAIEARDLKRAFINVDFELLRTVGLVDKPLNAEVILEISESEAVTNIEQYLDVVESWRQRGFQFAIDDFGSAFLSLPFVAQLVPSFIKMDRSAFLQAADSDTFSSFLRDMILAMRNYSKEGIIAEGVETEAELAVVNRLGVLQVQGHLTGRPGNLEPSDRKP